MISCAVVTKQRLKHLPLVMWSQAFHLLWQINPETSLFGLLWSHFWNTKASGAGWKEEKGWWEQAGAGPHPRGQSKGSMAMPTVGTQLERNVDAETPTSGALPRTSNPAALSLSVSLPPNSTMRENLLPPSPHSLSPKPLLLHLPSSVSHSFCHSA